METVKIMRGGETMTVTAEEGEYFRDVLLRENIPFPFPCGGRGICGKCKVRLLAGGFPPDYTERESLEGEELQQGIRLACRLRVRGETVVELLEHVTEERILEVGSERGIVFDPLLQAEEVAVEEPVLEDPVPDAERLRKSASKVIRSVEVLRKLPSLLRENGHTVEVVSREDEIIDVRPPEGRGLYGVGVDIGTTTVALTLVDMKTGQHVYTASTKNPQEPFGSDVVSRIEYCGREEGNLAKLSTLIREAVDALVGELCGKAGVEREDIYEIVVVGNTVMNHLFLGIDPRYIAVSPYVPAMSQGVRVKARDLGIEVNPTGEVYACPNIAGFVGGDTVGGILDCGMLRSEEPLLLVDIGTNGEIALGDSRGVTVCSTAAGPAFEGVNISHGMRAGRGAIERVEITDGSVAVDTIGNEPPRGICGSGIVDAVYGMLRNGVIDRTGRFAAPGEVSSPLRDRVRTGKDGGPEFVLVSGEEAGTGRDITLTQKDVREFQLAKSAVACGVSILLEKAGLKAGDVKQLLLAGAFGNYIRRESAVGVGLFPGFAPEQIKFVGNAAAYGAVMMLLSKRELYRSGEMRDRCTYVEVGALPEFQQRFADMMFFGDGNDR